MDRCLKSFSELSLLGISVESLALTVREIFDYILDLGSAKIAPEFLPEWQFQHLQFLHMHFPVCSQLNPPVDHPHLDCDK